MPGSFHWYQSLFGQPETSSHNDFGQILDSDGTVLLCLHEWGAHEHPSLLSPDHATPGNGLLLFFKVDDFDMALARARALVAQLEEEPHVNPNTGTEEFSLRDRRVLRHDQCDLSSLLLLTAVDLDGSVGYLRESMGIGIQDRSSSSRMHASQSTSTKASSASPSTGTMKKTDVPTSAR